MVNDDNDYKLDVYKIDTRTKLDKKRIFIMVILILLLFCILLTINHIKNLMEEYKVYKQYEAQLNSIKHQEEEKQAKIKELQSELNESDYKIIKCNEYELAGLELPYDIEELHKQRQALRDKINKLQESEG